MPRLEIRENEIEDIFALYPMQLRQVLGLSNDIHLVARQKILPSGRLDLVYSHLSDLLLIELKVERFRQSFVDQVMGYKGDLEHLQQTGAFIHGALLPILLCPEATGSEKQYAAGMGVDTIVYDPADVLTEFYRNAPLDVSYLDVKPVDIGVWRLGLINEAVCLAAKHHTVAQIAAQKGQSPRTVGNQMRLADALGLVTLKNNQVQLTATGEDFVRARDELSPPDLLAPEQAAVIRKFILAYPFFSGVTFGILTLVSSIFELSRNTYPVPLGLVAGHFIKAAGLNYSWDSEKAVRKGVRMYTNYDIDLGLVGKVGDHYFVTPSGLSFVLLLNMHKSLKLIENAKRIE